MMQLEVQQQLDLNLLLLEQKVSFLLLEPLLFQLLLKLELELMLLLQPLLKLQLQHQLMCLFELMPLQLEELLRLLELF